MKFMNAEMEHLLEEEKLLLSAMETLTAEEEYLLREMDLLKSDSEVQLDVQKKNDIREDVNVLVSAAGVIASSKSIASSSERLVDSARLRSLNTCRLSTAASKQEKLATKQSRKVPLPNLPRDKKINKVKIPLDPMPSFSISSDNSSSPSSASTSVSESSVD
jgi:hypothetical protein